MLRKYRRYEFYGSFGDYAHEILYSEGSEGHVQSIELKPDLDQYRCIGGGQIKSNSKIESLPVSFTSDVHDMYLDTLQMIIMFKILTNCLFPSLPFPSLAP